MDLSWLAQYTGNFYEVHCEQLFMLILISLKFNVEQIFPDLTVK